MNTQHTCHRLYSRNKKSNLKDSTFLRFRIISQKGIAELQTPCPELHSRATGLIKGNGIQCKSLLTTVLVHLADKL